MPTTPRQTPLPCPAGADVTAVILAGGKSRRMGRDKATLVVGGKTLFEGTRAMFAGLFPQVLIAGDRPDLASGTVPCFPDIFPGSALGGIHNGLFHAKTPWIFIAPCDLPFPDARLVMALLNRRANADCVVIRTPEGLEPVFALYHQNCRPVMERMLTAGHLRITDFFPQVNTSYLDSRSLPDNWQRALYNLNAPDDLRGLAATGDLS